MIPGWTVISGAVCLDKSNKSDLLSMMLCVYVVRTSKSEGTRLGFHVLSMGVERRTLNVCPLLATPTDSDSRTATLQDCNRLQSIIS